MIEGSCSLEEASSGLGVKTLAIQRLSGQKPRVFINSVKFYLYVSIGSKIRSKVCWGGRAPIYN